jgi:hypothetical protein
MNQSEFQETVESLRDAELLRYAKEYVRLSITESDNPRSDVHSVVDIIYAECVRRGKEWLYDKAREAVCRETAELCMTQVKEGQACKMEQRAFPHENSEDEPSQLFPEIY